MLLLGGRMDKITPPNFKLLSIEEGKKQRETLKEFAKYAEEKGGKNLPDHTILRLWEEYRNAGKNE